MDPAKVRAIIEMPPPKDVAAMQRLLGLAQYLGKFLPHLLDITKPLREITQKDADWIWDHAQQNALDTLKRVVTSTPILRYYNLSALHTYHPFDPILFHLCIIVNTNQRIHEMGKPGWWNGFCFLSLNKITTKALKTMYHVREIYGVPRCSGVRQWTSV